MQKIIYILTILIVCSCGTNSYKETIDRAERLVDTELDSAYNLLSPISIKEISGAKNRAKFALVYSNILNKRYAYIKDDSLISHAVDYYMVKGSDVEKARTLYLLGMIQLNINDIPQCVKSLTQALRYEHNDNYLKGSIHSPIGYMYTQQGSFREAASSMEMAAKHYLAAGRVDLYTGSLANIGANYYYLDEFENALDYFNKSHLYALELKDTTLILSTRRAIATSKYEMDGEFNAARKYLLEGYDRYNNSEAVVEDYGFLNGLYLDKGDVDSARYYMNRWVDYHYTTTNHGIKVADKTAPMTEVSILKEFRKIEIKAGDYKKALEYDDKADHLLDSIHKADKNKTIEQLSAIYNNKLYKELLATSESRKYFIINISIISFILVILTALVVFYRYRLKMVKKDQELNQQQEILESLSNAKYELQLRYDTTLSEPNSYNDNSLDNIKTILGKLNSLIEKIPRYEKDPKKFVDLFLEVINSSNNSQAGTLLYEIVNRQYNGILDHLRDKYQLSQYELEICSMICMGFSNSSMRIVLNHTNTYTIYNYRSKLKSKLGLSINEDSIEAFFNSIKRELPQ